MASPTVERKIKTRKFHKKLFEIYCASIIKENIFVLKNVSVVVKLRVLSVFLELLPQDSWLGVRMRPNLHVFKVHQTACFSSKVEHQRRQYCPFFSEHFISITNMTDGQGEEERRDESRPFSVFMLKQQHHRPHLVDLSTFSDDFSKL